jgi:UDP-glucose 4-epimerase
VKVLVTGIAGKLGRLVAQMLVERGHEVIGIDRRAWREPPAGVTIVETDIRKREAEEVFRTARPEAVIHMATVTHLTATSEDRYRINLYGTRAVFEHAHTYGLKRAVFVGRHTYYGAAPDSPLYQREDAPPMAVTTFPELADLVAADLYAGSALWRYPELDTVVLRVCYTLGPTAVGTLAKFLAGPRVPTILGYDPLFQLIHDDDAARAICIALEAREGPARRGVFNVCGPDPLPLSLLAREAGRQVVPVPELLYRLAVGRFGLPRLPKGAVEHLKYPCVIDGAAFRSATGFSHRLDVDAAIDDFQRAIAGRAAPASATL